MPTVYLWKCHNHQEVYMMQTNRLVECHFTYPDSRWKRSSGMEANQELRTWVNWLEHAQVVYAASAGFLLVRWAVQELVLNERVRVYGYGTAGASKQLQEGTTEWK